MASLRKSPRNASPAAASVPGPSNVGLDLNAQPERFEGIAPPPVPQPIHPAPPLEDPRGIGTIGMREQMNTFRTTSNPPKVKLRVKQYDPSRRSYFARNDDASDGKEAVKISTSRKVVGEKAEEKSGRQQYSKDRHEDGEYTPKTQTHKHTQPQTTSATSTRSTPSKTDDFDPTRLRVIVDSAVQRAGELGNDLLGEAIRSIYEDSLNNRDLSRLLVAVLQQKQSPEQAERFQELIKMARRKVKEQRKVTSSKPTSAKAKSKMPSATNSPADTSKPKIAGAKSPIRRTRQSTARSESTTLNSSEAHPSTSSTQVNGKRMSSENKKADEPPTKRVKRSRSASSLSTLSSVSSQDIDNDIGMSDEADVDQAGGKRGSSSQPPKGVFITKSAPKKPHGSLAGPKLGKESAKDETEDREREVRKRKLIRTDFDGYHVDDSSLRSAPRPRLERIQTETTFPNLSSGPQSGRGSKKDSEDIHSPASSIQADLLIPPPPEARRISRSRAATPNIPRTRGGADRGKARIKESPMKKKNGVVAGIAPRSTRAKDGAAGAEQTTDDEGENVDFCYACGDRGTLLCCDGCVRSFHFKCLDPPMDGENPPEGRWFCQNCISKRDDTHVRLPRGLFALLEHNFEQQNPRAFGLPHHIRDYFEGVGTAEDGEYEEISNVKTRNSKIPGYDEVQKQDNLKLRDAKNQVILCFKCGLSSMGKREIVACDYCGLHWHLDCLSPPLANPPYRDPQNRAKYRWMCPAHSSDVLTAVGLCGRRYKTRRPKNAEIVDTQLRRGFHSNGLVEIELDPSDDEMVDETPRVYRVTEGSVRLDFNDRIQKDWEDKMARDAYTERVARQSEQEKTHLVEQANAAFKTCSAVEQNVTLSLCELASSSPDSLLKSDQIKELIKTLLNEAPAEVLALLEEKPSETPTQTPLSIPPSPPDSDESAKNQKSAEVRQLLLLQELIRNKLTGHGHV